MGNLVIADGGPDGADLNPFVMQLPEEQQQKVPPPSRNKGQAAPNATPCPPWPTFLPVASPLYDPEAEPSFVAVTQVAEMRKLHHLRMELEEKFEEERRALLKKYEALEAPLNQSRRSLVVKEDGTPAIDNFWLQVFANCSFIRDTMLVGEKDDQALAYLRDVRCLLLEDCRSFKFEFEFAENPFFADPILTKEYRLDEDGDPIGAEGYEINWKQGKNLTVKLKKKKKAGKKGPAITKTEACETFFNWFAPPKVPDEEDCEDMDEEAQEELEEAIEEDFDQGMTLKDKIIPHAVMWFVGEAEDSDESSDEDDEEDSEEDSDDEDDAPAPKGGRRGVPGGKKATGPPPGTFGAPPTGADGEQTECKQQ